MLKKVLQPGVYYPPEIFGDAFNVSQSMNLLKQTSSKLKKYHQTLKSNIRIKQTEVIKQQI